MADRRLKLGAHLWSQYATWPELRMAGLEAERLGYDDLWTWNHLYPIVGPAEGSTLDGWMVLGAWAEATDRIRLGLMATANTFLEPTLVAKMISTVDHIAGGRALLGIGAGWFEVEHQAFGLRFGSSPGERLDWLGESLQIITDMLDGQPASGVARYRARAAVTRPLPLQSRIPVLVAGAGERKTLRLVARFADACNFGGTVEEVQRRDAMLQRHCEDIGRDPATVERTLSAGVVIIRDTERRAKAAFQAIGERNRGHPKYWRNFVGTAQQVAEELAPYVNLGFRHIIAGFPAPYDRESMQRLVGDVKPVLTHG